VLRNCGTDRDGGAILVFSRSAARFSLSEDSDTAGDDGVEDTAERGLCTGVVDGTCDKARRANERLSLSTDSSARRRAMAVLLHALMQRWIGGQCWQARLSEAARSSQQQALRRRG
jgi:hypothetical protein